MVETFEIPMPNNSVLCFSLETNKLFKHKIVIDNPQKPDDGNEWLGVTLRASKFFVHDGIIAGRHLPTKDSMIHGEGSTAKSRRFRNLWNISTWPPGTGCSDEGIRLLHEITLPEQRALGYA